MGSPARYDGLADWYDDYARSNELVGIGVTALGRLLGPGPGRCLDVGCGTGIAFPMLAALDWSIVGLDVSADQLAAAEARAHAARVRLVCADATVLPFPDSSFDASVSLLTHTDFEDVGAVFREMARVVAPGGHFVYVGVHPCFVGPMIERPANASPRLQVGYRSAGWWSNPSGVVRSRVGVNHAPLERLLNAVLDAGLRLDRVEEPGDEDYPALLGLAATRLR
jgi:SAM-dependent methyltransferase